MKWRTFLAALLCTVCLTACQQKDTRYPLDAQRIQSDTQYLCEVIGPRPTGTQKEKEGCDWLEGQLEGLEQGELDRHLAAFNLENSAASPGEGAVLLFGTQGGTRNGTYLEGNFLEPMENLVTETVTQSYQELYAGEKPPVFHKGGSDHLMFHKAGIDAANVCWKFLREDGEPRLPEQYHQPTDTVEGMNFEDAVLLGRCILDSLYKLIGVNSSSVSGS